MMIKVLKIKTSATIKRVQGNETSCRIPLNT